jgi:type II secretory pathway pseudopilin PulG
MKFRTQRSDKWQVTGLRSEASARQAGGMKKTAARVGISCHASRVTCHVSAFTLAEVLAAMLFLAIVIPAAVEAMHVASLAGEVAARKGVAARIADRVLNESLVTTNWNLGTQNGTITEGAEQFRWTLSSQTWPVDTMELLTAEVIFSAQGHDYSVKLSTLANLQTLPLTTTSAQQ